MRRYPPIADHGMIGDLQTIDGQVDAGEALGSLESVKAVSEVYIR
jgi:glycine cleavage system H lipoate-binding protein